MICNNTRMQTDADLYKAETPVCMINIKYCCNIVFYVLLNVQQPYCLTYSSNRDLSQANIPYLTYISFSAGFIWPEENWPPD